ncbi:MAG: hypothetical protein ABI672_07960 [Vicinamibacteria bacterium]
MIHRRSVLKGLAVVAGGALSAPFAVASIESKVRVTLVRWPYT